MHLRHRSRSVLLVGTCAAALVLGAVPAGTASATPGSTPEAAEALATVEDLFTGPPAQPGSAAAAAQPDASMALLDLAQALDDLDAEDRATAEGYLARPTEPNSGDLIDYDGAQTTQLCDDEVCVHYVDAAGEDRDSDQAATTAFAQEALATVQSVRGRMQEAGYRDPLSDEDVPGDNGGDDRFDVYLGDTGAQSVYGYCAVDDGDYATHRAAPAYCVLDNDFRRAQFPSNTPLGNLQVTTAHEYFHAIQFAYDVGEDRWFQEATATWVEDELYDDVNDNVQYLEFSPLTMPGDPLDSYDYPAWIFFRYLTERFDAAEGGLPVLIRDVWERLAVDAPEGDDYSMRAVRRALADLDEDFTDVFADFVRANLTPKASYEEGAENSYPKHAEYRKATLTKKEPGTGPVTATIDHLAGTTMRYRPGSALTGGKWRLRLRFDLPSASTGATALATVVNRSAPNEVVPISLDASGAGNLRLDFSNRRVTRIDLTLVNASIRYACDSGTPFSCGGRPQDDRRPFKVWAQALKAS